MSIAAMNWAMKQRTDGPSAQIILFTIADRANEHGICRHADPDTIAELTRQSRATVFRRLEELERAGTLCRLTRHLDDGRREYEIRLQTAATVNYRVTKERDIHHVDQDGDTISTVPFGGEPQPDEAQSQSETHPVESQVETGSVSPVRPSESQSCDPQKSPSKNPKKDSPQPPEAGGNGTGAADQPSGAELEKRAAAWARFETAWREPILHQETCRGIWAVFTDAEREQAIRVARGYVNWRLSQRRPPNVCNAQKLLREVDAWPGYLKHAGPDPSLRTFIREGTPAFDALRVLERIGGWLPKPATYDEHEQTNGLWRPKPLAADILGLAVFANKPVSEWTVLDAGTKPFFAWSGRLYDWTGVRRDELRVPCLFPPRKDGSIGPDPNETG